MSRIPYVTRIDGRYRYRRRVHLRNLISRPVTIALKTADPDEARARSALLSARFVALTRSLKTMYAYGEDFLSGEEIQALVQSELKRELERAIGPILASDDAEGALRQTRIFAEAYTSPVGSAGPPSWAKRTSLNSSPRAFPNWKCSSSPAISIASAPARTLRMTTLSPGLRRLKPIPAARSFSRHAR